MSKRLDRFSRITPDEVLAAYAATGLEPVFDVFRVIADDGQGGWECIGACALIAINHMNSSDAMMVSECLWGGSGKSGAYYSGFVAGWDEQRRPMITGDRDSWKLGYKDGCAARRAVKAEAALSPKSCLVR